MKKCVKERYAAGRTGESQREKQGICKGKRKAESKYTTENKMSRVLRKDGRGKKDREI